MENTETNTNNNNSVFNAALEGMAALGNKSPVKESGAKVTRQRLSGAARRRLKKQLLQEAETGGSRSQVKPQTAAEHTPRTGEPVASVSCKRSRQPQSTPSPAEKQQPGKRPKVSDQRSYSQAASGIVRIAIVPTSYPDKQFNSEQALELKECVEGCILKLVRGTKAPTFKGTSERDGAVIFNCSDEDTGAWLKSLTSEIIMKDGVQLRALRVDELPKRHRVVVHVENPKKPIDEILDLIDRQNPGVGNDWVVAKGSENRDGNGTHFAALIREGTLRALEALNFKPFCGLGQAAVRLIGGESRKKTEKNDVEGPAS